jgi:acyl-CoA synthetase (AMP-forming)/AMP-acid ligase II
MRISMRARTRCAALLRARGLERGDHIAILMENHPRFLEICWAAQRSGLFFTPISWRFKLDEAAYVVENSGAKALFASRAQSALAAPLHDRARGLEHAFGLDGPIDGFDRYEAALDTYPSTPIADETLGRDMLYSSGSTGRPKAIRNELPEGGIATIPPVFAFLAQQYRFDPDTVNLTPAPLYHAGPLRYSMTIGHTGGTNIIMEKFDAAEALALCERFEDTHAEWVPTMLVRMLKLPQAQRCRYDLSQLRMCIHGTGPCAPEVKRAVIEWLGPIVHENYGGTEGNGLCLIDSNEWLAHPGSVGRAVIGNVHILDADGNELPPGETGQIYFGDGPRFEYHRDPERTRAAYDARGWSTLGDIGYLDADGYLYLVDRSAHMIVSGGINIYPLEIENVLITHAGVADVAVFGVPDEDFGERVHAVVQPAQPAAGTGLEAELIAYCRDRLAHYKCPRSIDFASELPRHETGKIYKARLKEDYGRRRAQSD